LFVLDNAVLHGVVVTVRRDIAYDEPVPKSFRIGFGHPGAYAAKIELSELIFAALAAIGARNGVAETGRTVACARSRGTGMIRECRG
jgi:hypothetical protein